jgi:hypothetical protein
LAVRSAPVDVAQGREFIEVHAYFAGRPPILRPWMMTHIPWALMHTRVAFRERLVRFIVTTRAALLGSRAGTKVP